MRMQEICKISGFTKRNIHYYIKEGLLSPASDVQNGYYDFSEEEVKRLSLIRLFRNAGLSISVIRSILNTPDSTGLYLNQHIKELHKEKERLEGILSAMNDLFERLPVNTDIDKLRSIFLKYALIRKVILLMQMISFRLTGFCGFISFPNHR